MENNFDDDDDVLQTRALTRNVQSQVDLALLGQPPACFELHEVDYSVRQSRHATVGASGDFNQRIRRN